MKKIGILYGMEFEFPEKLVETINSKKPQGIKAELIKTGTLRIDEIPDYSVILDRVSHEVPFYKSFLKQALLNGTKVINNPFWNAYDNNYFQNTIAVKFGFNVPRTVALPTKEHPYGTNSDFMRNLMFPLLWDEVFEYTGFPAIIKPNKEHAGKSEFVVYNPEEFFAAYDLTGNIVMILQQYIEFDLNFICYTIGGKDVRVMNFDPKKPYNLRFPGITGDIDEKLKKEIGDICLKISSIFGLEFNAIEVGVKDNIPYIKNFYNPSPFSDSKYIKEDNFEWLIEKSSDFLIGEASKTRTKPRKLMPSEFLFGQLPEKQIKITKTIKPTKATKKTVKK